MTSTSFNVGVQSDGKNSSRVLRPPGGGHTDIFGLKEPQTAPCVRREDNRRNASSILEGTDQEKPKEIQKVEPVKEQIIEAPKQQEQEAPKKVRVPPGGFSSGLW